MHNGILGVRHAKCQKHRMDAVCHLYDLRQQLRRQTIERRRSHQRTQRTQQRDPNPRVFLSRQRLQQPRVQRYRQAAQGCRQRGEAPAG